MGAVARECQFDANSRASGLPPLQAAGQNLFVFPQSFFQISFCLDQFVMTLFACVSELGIPSKSNRNGQCNRKPMDFLWPPN